jgi:hypothetical protein
MHFVAFRIDVIWADRQCGFGGFEIWNVACL